MITTEFLSDLNRFRLIVKKRVTSSYAGGKTSVFLGRGTTIKDYRAYVPGDDIRLIDWKIYARTDNLYIKRFEEEKNLTIHIIVDQSASMNFGKGLKKFDYAAMLGVGFAYLAQRDNEKFEFSTFSERLDIIQPRAGGANLASLVDRLNSVKLSGKTGLRDTLRQYRKQLTSRAMIVIISDFLFDLEDIKMGLYSLGNHDIKVIQVLDKEEINLELHGDLKLHDSEDSRLLHTYVSPRLKSEYQQKLEVHVNEIEKICSQMGIDFFPVSTETPIFDVFFEVLNKQ